MRLDFSKIDALNGRALSTSILVHRDQVMAFLAACEDEDIIWKSDDMPTEFNPVLREYDSRQWYAICFWTGVEGRGHLAAMTYAAYDDRPDWYLDLEDILLHEDESDYENLILEELL